jgi:hypothetical protein
MSCSGAHGKSVTAMLPLSSEAPGGPDMLLTASADGTIAGKRLIAGQGRATCSATGSATGSATTETVPALRCLNGKRSSQLCC